MKPDHDVLIVGAGLSGCVMANLYAQMNKRVKIIDKKNHIGGKYYDYVDANGILVQKYGFRMMETADPDIIRFLEKHATWIQSTDNTKLRTEGTECFKDHRDHGALSSPGAASGTASLAETFKDLPDHLRYFAKFYETDPSQVQCSDYDKIKLRHHKPLSFQAVPLHGYTRFFESLLNHENITVQLESEYTHTLRGSEATFYCGKIDELYKNKGIMPLDYVTTYYTFETSDKTDKRVQRYQVLDYPDPETLYIRSVEYKGTISREYNTIGEDGDICIPLRTAKNKIIYNKYMNVHKTNKDNVILLGATANYESYRPATSIRKAFDLFDIFGPSGGDRARQVFVEQAYQKILNRAPDASGLETYTRFLRDHPVHDLECILYDSDEYIEKKPMFDRAALPSPSAQAPISGPDFEKLTRGYGPGREFADIAHHFGINIRTESWSYTKKNDNPSGRPSKVPTVVVSRYTEDVSWTELFDDVIIYNKGPRLQLRPKDLKGLQVPDARRVVNAENVGREGETYLKHIIENYDKLEDYIVFCQANPFEHSPRFIDSILNHWDKFDEYQPLTWRWKDVDDSISWLSCKNKTGIPPIECRDLTKCFYLDDCPIHCELVDRNFMCVYPLTWLDGGFNDCLIPRLVERLSLKKSVLEYVYERLNLGSGTGVPEVIPFNYSANFGVSKDRIRRHSKAFYSNVRTFLLEHPDHGYILERLWMHFFTGF